MQAHGPAGSPLEDPGTAGLGLTSMPCTVWRQNLVKRAAMTQPSSNLEAPLALATVEVSPLGRVWRCVRVGSWPPQEGGHVREARCAAAIPAHVQHQEQAIVHPQALFSEAIFLFLCLIDLIGCLCRFAIKYFIFREENLENLSTNTCWFCRLSGC